MIRFNTTTELTLATNYNPSTGNIGEEQIVLFHKSEVVKAIPVNESDMYADLEFEDGSVAFGVHKDCFLLLA